MKKLEFELYCIDSDETVLNYPRNYAIDITRQTLDVCGKLEFFTPTKAEAFWFRVIGPEKRDIFIRKGFDIDEPNIFYKTFRELDKKHLKKCIKEGVPYLYVGADIRALRELQKQGAKLALLTDAPDYGIDYRNELLQQHHVYFNLIVCSDGSKGNIKSKPYPDCINVALDKLNIAPEKTCHVDDLVAGILMSQAAGVTPIWKYNDRVRPNNLNSVRKIIDLTELL